MKLTLHAAAAVALMSVVTAMPAVAAGPRASGSNLVPQAVQPQSTSAMAPSHYEWQYHYVGHNARFAGYWALVK